MITPALPQGSWNILQIFCRIIEQLRSESTSTDHLVQPSFSKQGQLDHIARDSAQLGFEYH